MCEPCDSKKISPKINSVKYHNMQHWLTNCGTSIRHHHAVAPRACLSNCTWTMEMCFAACVRTAKRPTRGHAHAATPINTTTTCIYPMRTCVTVRRRTRSRRRPTLGPASNATIRACHVPITSGSSRLLRGTPWKSCSHKTFKSAPSEMCCARTSGKGLSRSRGSSSCHPTAMPLSPGAI